jgi:hypothetical protein
MKSHRGSLVVLASLLVLAQGAAAQTVSNTWTGNSGLWNDAGNWNPRGVPNNTNGLQYIATVNSGSATLTSDILLSGLNDNGGSIVGGDGVVAGDSITVLDTLNLTGNSDRVLGIDNLILPTGSQALWTDGSFSIWGSTEILNAGTFTVAATTNLSLAIDPLHTAPDPNDPFGGTFFNQVGGVFAVIGSQLEVASGFINAGTVVQDGGSAEYSSMVANTGTFRQNSGRASFSGIFSQTSGSYYVGSNAVLSGTITFGGGRLGGTGTINPSGNLAPTAGTVLDPGDNPGQAGRLTITAKLVLPGGGVLHADIGGTTAGITYDQVVTENKPSLDGGVLEISLINHFAPDPSDTFTILITSDGSSVNGSFANVANGLRLFTMDDDGSFLVLYGARPNADEVVLTDFEATPEPGVTALLALCACCLLIKRWRVTSRPGIRPHRTPAVIS